MKPLAHSSNFRGEVPVNAGALDSSRESVRNKVAALVSVIIVVRNGEKDVLRAIESVCNQDVSPSEVIVVDGRSTDSTRAIVQDYAAREQRCPIRVLDNPGLIQATGWNVGIRAARGQYLLRLDAAHCRLEPNYLRLCLEKLQQLRASDPAVAATGGRRISAAPERSQSPWAEAIAAAQSCRFGVGNATYRLGTQAGFTDTLGVPLYERDILLQIGLFDESLGRSEDNELHARLRRHGYKLYFFPECTYVYYSRTSIRGLASQMFRNGWWISSTVMRSKSFPFGLRHVMPFAFYATVCFLLAGGIAHLSPAWSLLGAVVGIYLLASIAAAAAVAPSLRFWRVAAVFWMMHACYAAGTVAGFFSTRTTPVGTATAPGANLE